MDEADSRRESARASERSSEDRFRRLTTLSADWYWEQDENLRFTAQHGGVRPSGLFSGQDIGKTRWELESVGISEEQWQAHRATLAARLPFNKFEMKRRGHDGRLHHVSISREFRGRSASSTWCDTRRAVRILAV